MKIKLAEVRRAFELLMAHTEEMIPSQEFELDKEYYWNVPQDKRYDQHDKPTDLTMGQLTDDWNEVRQISSGERDAIGYGLVWLSTILRRIGETTP